MRKPSPTARLVMFLPPLALALLMLAGCGPNHDSVEALGFEAGEERTIEGVVVENTADPCLFPDEHRDPCYGDMSHSLYVEVDGVTARVRYDAIEDCGNVDAKLDGQKARVNTRVEVFARVASNDDLFLDTCPSDEYLIQEID